MTRDPNRPDDADTEGKTVPPYEGRKKSAGAAGKGRSAKGDARTAGASNPVEDEDMRAVESMEAEGGTTSAPSDEKPADRTRRARDDDSGTGPAHHRGTQRGEDRH